MPKGDPPLYTLLGYSSFWEYLSQGREKRMTGKLPHLTEITEGTFLEALVNHIEEHAPCSWAQLIDSVYHDEITYSHSLALNDLLESAERLGLICDVGVDRWERIVRYENAMKAAPPRTISQNVSDEKPEPMASDPYTKGGGE